jgi:hypothetical protein
MAHSALNVWAVSREIIFRDALLSRALLSRAVARIEAEQFWPRGGADE